MAAGGSAGSGGAAGSSAGDAGSAGSSAGSSGSSAGGSASGSGGSGTAGSAGTDSCPSQRGPEMVRVTTSAGSFCIDSTEVSRGMYAEFLADLDGLAPQPDYCAWNETFEPELDVMGGPEFPAVGIDFCDARAYCEWAGKRLCGKIGGGATAYDAYADASESQWFAACSAEGSRLFPYGDEYDAMRCNGVDYGAGSLLPVGTSECEGGFDGIFNMSGNAAEWEDACTGTDGSTDRCRVRGGLYSSAETGLRCDSIQGLPVFRDFISTVISIRCCAP